MNEGKILVETHPIGSVSEEQLAYAVICALMNGKLVCVKHHCRESWEIPGGRREIGESILAAAKRELFEETGAVDFTINEICDYSVSINQMKSYGRLYQAVITAALPLPAFEIKEISLFDNLPEPLTYPEIQPLLLRVAWPKFEKPKVEYP